MADKLRYLKKYISQDSFKLSKMAFISGPRQVGKTTLAKSLLQTDDNYFLFDEEMIFDNSF